MNTPYTSLRGQLAKTPKKWLITGAAGFIGMHTSLRLLARGDSVIALDNLDDDVTLKQARLARLLPHANFSFHKLDVADRTAVAQLFEENRGLSRFLQFSKISNLTREE